MRLLGMVRVAMCVAIVSALGMPGWVAAQSGANTILKPAEVEKLFPATVYYVGQSAPSQLRNSGGVKFGDGHYVLVSLVDTSGYSTGVAAKYQGYIITETTLKIGGKLLPAGAYGFGFLNGDEFLITDLGGGQVLTEKPATDQTIDRPRPLQVSDDPAGGFRLYAGRRYIHFTR